MASAGLKKALFCYNQSIFSENRNGVEHEISNVCHFILCPDDSLPVLWRGTGHPGNLRQANESFNEGQYDKAINDYNTVIAKYPDLTEAYFNRGMTYYKKGKLDEAISDLSRVISARPKQIDALNSRGLPI